MIGVARRLLDWLETKDPELDAVRRAARAAITLPIAAGIGLLFGSGQTPLFSIFGSIALLIVVDFPGNRSGRAVAYAGLALVGAGLIVLGTLVSPIPWLAVTAMFVLGVGVTFAGVLSTAVAAARRATLMPFVLTVCTPAGPIPERLLGWSIAVVIAVPSALFLLPPRHHDDLRRHAAQVCQVLAHRLMGRSSAKQVNSAMNALFANYVNSEYRPVGLTAGSRALVRVVDDLGWLCDRVTDETAGRLGVMRDPAVRVLTACARLLRVARVADRAPDRAELDAALTELRAVAQGRYREDIAELLGEPDDAAALASIGIDLNTVRDKVIRTFGADAFDDQSRLLRQRQADEVPDRHRQAVHQERGDAHPGQHHPPPVAQRVGHGDQLRLVTEFGEEYHPEADENCGEHGHDLSTRRPGAPLAQSHRTSGRRSRPPNVSVRFAGRAARQYVDTTIGGYSPSLMGFTLSTRAGCRQSTSGVRAAEIADHRRRITDDRIVLCGKQHRQNGGVGVADRVDADPADHRGDGAVGLGFDPGGAVLETEMRQTGQQHASRCGAGTFGQ